LVCLEGMHSFTTRGGMNYKGSSGKPSFTWKIAVRLVCVYVSVQQLEENWGREVGHWLIAK